MALTRQEINRRSRKKLGLKTKALTLDENPIAFFEQLAAHTGNSQAAILRDAMRDYAAKHGITPVQ